MALCDHLETSFAAERAALADPEAAQRVVDELTAVKAHIDSLKTAAAKWNQTLNDGIGDLSSDLDFDLRSRIREVTKEADAAIEAGDPADTWAEIGPWLQSRTAAELLANYEYLRDRATELSERVGEHFREASGGLYRQFDVHDPTPIADVEFGENLDLKKMRAVKQAMVALKSAYGGAMMFTVLGSMVGIMLGPIGIGIGLVLGHRGLREEKKRQIDKRRSEAKNEMRKYCDKITFVAAQGLEGHAAPGPARAARPLHRARRGAEQVQRQGADRGDRGREEDPGGAGEAAQGRRRRAGPARASCASSRRRWPSDDPRGPDPDRARRTRSRSTAAPRTRTGWPRCTTRLDQPLRVAVAGRVKAGKSTLLNALVGERLAPTDAGECTRIVTWYQDGHTYQVSAHLDRQRAAAAAVHPRGRPARHRPRRARRRGRRASSW